MKKRQYSYDPECEKLARYFLEDGTDKASSEIDIDAKELAQDIQYAVESFLSSRSRSDSD